MWNVLNHILEKCHSVAVTEAIIGRIDFIILAKSFEPGDNEISVAFRPWVLAKAKV